MTAASTENVGVSGKDDSVTIAVGGIGVEHTAEEFAYRWKKNIMQQYPSMK